MLALALALCNADRVVMSVTIVPLSQPRVWSQAFAGSFLSLVVCYVSLICGYVAVLGLRLNVNFVMHD
ncbi:hypothetical protein HanHA300_Chr15g0573111 [Helianthus annuus]|nr:hypothetical protein HanHA300_Chr15g0573111 [Helianthus annuus]KAJ0473805.1 hypothetical protein HanHA89_Chr15g0622591 [Helianthus annuus]KAJ0649380.1 hypothetical protein HanLR1_Chr15g0583671 [Helianthus annuus]